MNTSKSGYVDYYFQGRIFEVDEQDPQQEAEYLTKRLMEFTQADNTTAINQLRAQHQIREIGIEAEAGTNDLRNPLWLKLDTSRRLVGTTGKEVAPHVAELIRNAGIVGDGRKGNPIAFCVPNVRTGQREIWHIDPREIAALSRRQIEENLVVWVTQAIEAGKLL